MVFAFMEEFSMRMGKKITKISHKAMEALQKHQWPGNVRELRNVIEHSVILSAGDTLKLSFLGDSPTREPQPVTLAEAERAHILKTLETTHWRIKGKRGAAERLDWKQAPCIPECRNSASPPAGKKRTRRRKSPNAVGTRDGETIYRPKVYWPTTIPKLRLRGPAAIRV